MIDIYENLVNKPIEQQFYTGIVSSTNPLQVKLYPDDDAINVKCISSLLSITTDSNVILIKLSNQFIILGVIQTNHVPIGQVGLVKKSASETRNNTTTLTSDNHLTLTLPAYSVCELKLSLFVKSASTTTPDFKFAYTSTGVTAYSWRKPTGAGISMTSIGDAETASYFPDSLTNAIPIGLDYNAYCYITDNVIVYTGSSTGSITVQYAQNTATAEDVTVHSNSYFQYTKIGRVT